MNILITGAAGFLGSHLTDLLLSEGHTVIGVDNLSSGRKQNLANAEQNKNFQFIEADAISPPETYLPTETKLDLVYHLASLASPPRYQEFPVETYLVNSMGTHNLLQYLLLNHPDCRFVFASTSEAYGEPKEHPQKESYWGNVNPNGVRSCYDEGKRLGETICGVHARDLGLDVRIARIFNTYGPRMNPIDGRVVPNLITQAIANEPMTIHGDGSQTRSFCFVSDLVEGLKKLGLVDGLSGETINLGNPTEISVLELGTIVKKHVNSASEFTHIDRPSDDPSRRCPDISKAKQLLDWSPSISFDQGLDQTIVYFRS